MPILQRPVKHPQALWGCALRHISPIFASISSASVVQLGPCASDSATYYTYVPSSMVGRMEQDFSVRWKISKSLNGQPRHLPPPVALQPPLHSVLGILDRQQHAWIYSLRKRHHFDRQHQWTWLSPCGKFLDLFKNALFGAWAYFRGHHDPLYFYEKHSAVGNFSGPRKGDSIGMRTLSFTP